ncbi:signal peptidase I [Chloroflexota bacterium]
MTEYHGQLTGHRSFWARLMSAYHRSSRRELHRQVLRGALIGFLMVPILFTFFAGSALLFGYRFTGTFGTSMEPTLHNGDMIWLKHVNIAEVMIGDVVMLSSPEFGSISHRIIGMELVSEDRYLVETKGDANLISEYWIVGPDETVYIVRRSIPLGGYVLDFIGSLYGRISIVCLGITAIIAVRARRNKTKAGAAS